MKTLLQQLLYYFRRIDLLVVVFTEPGSSLAQSAVLLYAVWHAVVSTGRHWFEVRACASLFEPYLPLRLYLSESVAHVPAKVQLDSDRLRTLCSFGEDTLIKAIVDGQVRHVVLVRAYPPFHRSRYERHGNDASTLEARVFYGDFKSVTFYFSLDDPVQVRIVDDDQPSGTVLVIVSDPDRGASVYFGDRRVLHEICMSWQQWRAGVDAISQSTERNPLCDLVHWGEHDSQSYVKRLLRTRYVRRLVDIGSIEWHMMQLILTVARNIEKYRVSPRLEHALETAADADLFGEDAIKYWREFVDRCRTTFDRMLFELRQNKVCLLAKWHCGRGLGNAKVPMYLIRTWTELYNVPDDPYERTATTISVAQLLHLFQSSGVSPHNRHALHCLLFARWSRPGMREKCPQVQSALLHALGHLQNNPMSDIYHFDWPLPPYSEETYMVCVMGDVEVNFGFNHISLLRASFLWKCLSTDLGSRGLPPSCFEKVLRFLGK